MTEKPPFIAPATREEGLARLLAATLYRQNPGIPFFECRLVEDEIERLEKWCRTALRPMTRKEVAEVLAERRKVREARAAAEAAEAREAAKRLNALTGTS